MSSSLSTPGLSRGPRASHTLAFLSMVVLTAVCDSHAASPADPVQLTLRLILPPALHPSDIYIAILAADGPIPRDITRGHPTIDPDSVLLAFYDDPGPSIPILARFTYPPSPGAPLRTWLSAIEPGRTQIDLPAGDPPTTPGRAGLDLRPSLHGFRFVNRFEGAPIPALGRALGIRLDAFGLCGGMSFAAADLFLADRPRPGTAAPPPAGSPLFDLIYRRQLDSFGPLGAEGLRFARWMTLPDDTIAGTRKRTYDELHAIRALIDAGQPAILGLVYVSAADHAAVWQNHQVLAYAYDAGRASIIIRIYDPNFPDRDDAAIRATPLSCGLLTNPSEPSSPIDIPGLRCTQTLGARDLRPIRGLFLMPYSPLTPPADLSANAPAAPGSSR